MTSKKPQGRWVGGGTTPLVARRLKQWGDPCETNRKTVSHSNRPAPLQRDLVKFVSIHVNSVERFLRSYCYQLLSASSVVQYSTHVTLAARKMFTFCSLYYFCLHLMRFAAAASIWFEIWGSWIRVKKFRFSRKISEKFGFFQAISQTKKSIFQDKFSKNIDFLGDFTKDFDFSKQIFEEF